MNHNNSVNIRCRVNPESIVVESCVLLPELITRILYLPLTFPGLWRLQYETRIINYFKKSDVGGKKHVEG